ncbi:MAG: ABC transporter permease [Planctomycetia bacterium]|nr:ABC transporter permease [Planctomycetia bacterium]
MRVYRILRTAVRALRRNIMRSTLTTLGIVIGCASVIAMIEIGQGSATAVRKSIESMGSNNLLIQSGTAASGGVSFGSGTILTLTPGDGEAILAECPAVDALAPLVRVRPQLVYGNRNWVPPYIYGTVPEYLDVREWNLAEGDVFSDRDVRNGSKVCVVGQTIVRELFDGQSPLGKEIRIKSVPFRVVGVLTRKGASMTGLDQDDLVLAPWTTIKYRVAGTSAQTAVQTATVAGDPSQRINTLSQLYPGSMTGLYPVPSAAQLANTPQPVRFANVDQLLARVVTEDQIPVAMRQITELLRERHRIRSGEPDDFNIRDMTEMARTMSSTTKLMSWLLLIVACISLVVGGVGIMNIMLVSVTERTREIGLRMAVGARARDILRQFLVEAIVLCLLGGIMGIVLGRLGSMVVTSLLKWPTETSIPAVVAAFLVSASVGIAFGYYPAWKASRLDPIEALRYE